MIRVWLYDDNKYYINTDDFQYVEEISKNMTTVPLLVGYIRPRFNEETQEWCEGATQEEIEQWNQANNNSSDTITTEQQLNELSEYVLALEVKNIELEKTTNLNSEYVLELDTRLTTIENKSI